MKPMPTLAACVLVLASFAARAQAAGEFTLHAGQVHFRAPAEWTAVMEKTDGNPQAIAFSVPDASASGSNDSATVTVKSRQLANAAQFATVVQEEFERSKQQPGYASAGSASGSSTHHYTVVRGGTTYDVRDSFTLLGTVAVEVRCQRPVLAQTPADWNAGFDSACAGVDASLQP
jgi:hypothetical protein